MAENNWRSECINHWFAVKDRLRLYFIEHCWASWATIDRQDPYRCSSLRRTVTPRTDIRQKVPQQVISLVKDSLRRSRQQIDGWYSHIVHRSQPSKLLSHITSISGRGAWTTSTANWKPCPKKIIRVQHVTKIFQALPLFQIFVFKFVRGGGEPGSRLASTGTHTKAKVATVKLLGFITVAKVDK